MAKAKRDVMKTSMYLERSAIDDLQALSAHTRVPMAEYLREAVDDLLKKHARVLRKAKA